MCVHTVDIDWTEKQVKRNNKKMMTESTAEELSQKSSKKDKNRKILVVGVIACIHIIDKD